MIIAATAVSMDAARVYKEVEQQKTSTAPLAIASSSTPANDFSARFSNLISTATSSRVQSSSVVTHPAGRENDHCEEPALLLSTLTEQLIGQQVTVNDVVQELKSPAPPGIDRPAELGFSVRRAELVHHSIFTQQEQIRVSAGGSVQTADGREISFTFGLEMERQSVSVQSTSLGLAPLFIDPLVLNFGGNPPFMSDSSFQFDLNGDGVEDELACPGSGCGFLSFDRNRDGIINDGLELFGPSSGSGFGELAGFDSDGNQWIDEQDPIFARLQVWMMGDHGEGQLLSMKEAGVGAISIGHVGSRFTLESSTGMVVGQVKASGIFLSEAGEVRSLQEIDLATPTPRSNIYGDRQEAGAVAELDQAIVAMRQIIELQRFQLRMLLARGRMGQGRDNRPEALAQLFEQLDQRRQASLSSLLVPRVEEPRPLAVAQPEEVIPPLEDSVPVRSLQS
ncbi:hypothetical protein [Desulfogranum mediterraneum]|uniref:hypothetical protein n=1 Tax=Desulfogranum mediterraneum TaxID=160661 RepID=UPI0004249FF6|nr:hypothetical protein [Desulfogranum mediterraneum]